MKVVLRASECASISELRSWLQIFGLALKVKAMGISRTSIKSPCLLVSDGHIRILLNQLTPLDYRIPQMLHALGCLQYSPPLLQHLRQFKQIEKNNPWEVQLRGCSIWCVELIRREIIRHNPNAQINAILIDFFLYDTIKEKEAKGTELVPHHRTRTIWY